LEQRVSIFCSVIRPFRCHDEHPFPKKLLENNNFVGIKEIGTIVPPSFCMPNEGSKAEEWIAKSNADLAENYLPVLLSAGFHTSNNAR